MKILHMITFLLLVVGGVNWGLIGLFDFNLVYSLLGGMPAIENIVYIVVGLSAIYQLVTHKNDCKVCSTGK